jgi:hypothetical protein
MTFKDPNTTILPVTVDSLDSVDENLRGIYAETTEGKYQIRADIAFQSDFERVRDTLTKERTSNKELTSKVKDLQSRLDAYDGLDATAVKGMRVELDNLKNNESDVNKIKSSKAELEIKFKELTTKFDELTKINETYLREKKTNTLREKARQALHQNGMPDYAIDDGLMYAERMLEMTDDGSVRVKHDNNLNSIYPEGVTVETWAGIIKKNKPHLFGGSIGGGAGGSGSESAVFEDWTNTGMNGGINLTKLAKAIREDPNAVRAVAKKKNIDLSRFEYMFRKE